MWKGEEGRQAGLMNGRRLLTRKSILRSHHLLLSCSPVLRSLKHLAFLLLGVFLSLSHYHLLSFPLSQSIWIFCPNLVSWHPFTLPHLFPCYHSTHPVHRAKWEVSSVIAWLRLPVPSQCQFVRWHKMRAECHGELSKTCSGSLLHLAVAPNDELGEDGGFTVQQRGHIFVK